MPLLLVEDLVVAFDPYRPHDNASKEMPNVIPSFVFLSSPMAKDPIKPRKFMKRVVSNPTEFKRILKAYCHAL